MFQIEWQLLRCQGIVSEFSSFNAFQWPFQLWKRFESLENQPTQKETRVWSRSQFSHFTSRIWLCPFNLLSFLHRLQLLTRPSESKIWHFWENELKMCRVLSDLSITKRESNANTSYKSEPRDVKNPCRTSHLRTHYQMTVTIFAWNARNKRIEICKRIKVRFWAVTGMKDCEIMNRSVGSQSFDYEMRITKQASMNAVIAKFFD